MIPIDQSVVDAGRGDCQRAVVASLLELELEQVPNFILFGDTVWFEVYNAFVWALGWQYEGCQEPGNGRDLLEEDSINGFFDATVDSKTLPGKTHAVVIDLTGTIVHDPNPNKRWQGVNVLESGELKNWYMFSKRAD